MNVGRPQILIISSDSDNRRALTSVLQDQGWTPLQAERIGECRDLFAANNICLTFCERRLADGTYQDLLSIAHTTNRKVPTVVTSRLADWDEYLEALRHGAVDLIASPCKPNDVSSAIAQAQREDHDLTANMSSAADKQRAISASSN
jgi:DNA-binding NtrC family response regulator